MFFQNSNIPKILIDIKTLEICHVNDSFLNNYPVKNDTVIGGKWYALARNQTVAQAKKILATLNEAGKTTVEFNLVGDNASQIFLKLHLHVINIADKSFYLGEFEDCSDQVFHHKLLKQLRVFQSIDFDSGKMDLMMKKMVEWTGVDFCFVVRKENSRNFNKIVWDYSKPGMAKHFVNSHHDFIVRKVNVKKSLEIPDTAYLHIPADEFLSVYSIDSLMVYKCFVDENNNEILVAGGKIDINWDACKLLFSELADHYTQNVAFKVLTKSHETASRFDILTGLINRRFIVNSIDNTINKYIKTNRLFAILFIDLYRFKLINDSLGHDVGDSVLISMAKILKQNVSAYGIAARYAGDEFLVLLHKIDNRDDAIAVGARILKDIKTPIVLDNGSEIKLTVSMGLSFFPDHSRTAEGLIKKADVALYDAKLNGKNRLSVFEDTQFGEQATQKAVMEKNLALAIKQNQLNVYYQPKINAGTEDIMGFEALVRWIHPELGLISPGLFIPLAEKTGLISEIGYYVIETACNALHNWQIKYNSNLSMSINLSSLQLEEEDLIEKIDKIIQKTHVHPKDVDFEVTESEKFHSVKGALLMFKKIVDLGCTLSIDDFGTGHSTLDYLKKIPAKTLKIDQSFVKNIGLDPDDEAILDATINMAKGVGHIIVAEGVETEEQRQYLTVRGCDYFQGYLFCRPLPEKEITAILEQREKLLLKS
ncbi:MAG: bifunctional diguanylate cyclase/phosphodiesterase [Proteobacteria bacterium]|nr:bifunctional diguanylate cyclase/phosphodiesterase [Pseudomonadota bacterium]